MSIPLDEYTFKVLQAQQVIAALIEKFGSEAESGKYVDLPITLLQEVFYQPAVGVTTLRDKAVVRLARPRATPQPQSDDPRQLPLFGEAPAGN